MKRLTLLFALASTAALVSAGAAIGHTAHAAGTAVVVKTRQTKYGTILVNGSGRTLYLDAGDKPPHFACTGGCLQAWPPLKATGTLKAQGAAKAADLGSTKDGSFKIVTYNGHPLYTFASDTGSADHRRGHERLLRRERGREQGHARHERHDDDHQHVVIGRRIRVLTRRQAPPAPRGRRRL